MNIAILGSRGIPPKYGGFETLANDLAREMHIQDHHVYVTGFDRDCFTVSVKESPHATVITVPEVGLRRLNNLLCTASALKILCQNFDLDAAIVLNDVNFFSALKPKQ